MGGFGVDLTLPPRLQESRVPKARAKKNIKHPGSFEFSLGKGPGGDRKAGEAQICAGQTIVLVLNLGKWGGGEGVSQIVLEHGGERPGWLEWFNCGADDPKAGRKSHETPHTDGMGCRKRWRSADGERK